MGYLFTSESVTSGHPDKLCDYISDSILDACIEADPMARVAIEVFVKGMDLDEDEKSKSFIMIGGEVSISKDVEIKYEEIARKCAIEVGYSDIKIGMDASDYSQCEVKTMISRQSEEIGQGVTPNPDLNLEQGAGDQGIVFGYATNESEYFNETKGAHMPLPILLSQKLTLAMTEARNTGTIKWARPDGKSQVTIKYNNQGEPKYVDTIVIAIQHDDIMVERSISEEHEHAFIYKEVKEKIINKVIPQELITPELKIIVNGTGRFCKGGPHADAGLTGRKIIVDTYGGSGRHGGGAFSGKDPSKVDRSGAYAARYAAKHIVASGLADICEIQLAYSIGVSKPISVNLNVETFGTSKYTNQEIKKIVEDVFDFRPAAIIRKLKLRSPIYKNTASGGHFGRKGIDKNHFTWEHIDDNIIKTLKQNN